MRVTPFNPITGNKLFGGSSDQEKAAERQYAEARAINPNIRNRFDNYKSPYEFGDIESKVGDVYSGYEDIINRDTAEEIARQQQGAASSLASRGVTGGSILTDTQSKIGSDINKSKTNALSRLGIGKSGQLADLMKYFNQLDFAKTGQATNVDQQNMQNLFAKFGLQSGAIGGLSDDTWLDDVFGGLEAAGNLAQGVGSIISSDIRFKENLILTGKQNGINIYEFNYIGNPKRFRGVIAQEVEHIPGAVETYGGYRFVNYSRVGIPFEEI